MESFNNNIRKIIEKQFEEAARMEDIRQKRDGLSRKAIEKQIEEEIKRSEAYWKFWPPKKDWNPEDDPNRKTWNDEWKWKFMDPERY